MTTETDTANVRPAEEPAAVAVFPAPDKLTAQNNSFTTITTLSTSFSSSCNSLDLSAAVEHTSSRSNSNYTRDGSTRNNHQSSSKSILIDALIDAAPEEEEEEEGGDSSSAYLSLSSSSLQQNNHRRSRSNHQQSGGAIKHFRGVLTTWEEQERAIVAARRGRTGRSQKSSIKDRMRLFESTKNHQPHQRGAPAHASMSVSSSHLLSRGGSKKALFFEPSRQSSCPDLNNSKVTTAAKPPLPTASRRSDGNASSSSLQLDEIARNGPNATPRRAEDDAQSVPPKKSIPNNRRTAGGRKEPEKEPKTGEKEPTPTQKKSDGEKQREPKKKTKSSGSNSGRLRGVLIPLEEQQRAIVRQRANNKKKRHQQGGNIRLAPRSPRPSSVKDRRVMFESKGPVRFHESMPSMMVPSFRDDDNDDDDSSTCSLDVNSIHSLCDDPRATLRGRLQALEDSLSGSMLDLGGANGGIQDEDDEHNNEQEQSLQSFWNSSRSILSLPNNESFSHEQQ